MVWLNPFRWVAPPGPKAKLSIFIFHRVLAEPDPFLPWEPDAARFDRILAFIGRYFHVLDLHDAVSRMKSGSLPAAPACITFDDGYLDNLNVAAPLLQKHDMPATFFVATAFSEGGLMWNDAVIEAVRAAPAGLFRTAVPSLPAYELTDTASRVAAYEDILVRLKHLPFDERVDSVDRIAAAVRDYQPVSPMMTVEQVRQLAKLGMSIGGHTHRHPILSRLTEDEARREIELNRGLLADWLGDPPKVFAYPNGVPSIDYGQRDRQLVRAAGYDAAVTTGLGVARRGDDEFQLPRFTSWRRGMAQFALDTLRNCTTNSAPITSAT